MIIHKHQDKQMKIFYLYIYEFQKGMRNLVLQTMHSQFRPMVEEKLRKSNISYLIHDISDTKINVYFGDPFCVATVKSFNKTNLSKLTHEEDFILGTMLGYDISHQCKRFLERAREDMSMVEMAV
jgi:hypothetical protein